MDTQKTRTSAKLDERNVKKIITIVVVGLIAGLIIIGIAFGSYWRSGLKAEDATAKKTYVVQVPMGSSTKQIGDILEKKGLIRSGFVFSYYAKVKTKTNFQAGYYTLSPSMDVPTMIKTMEKGGSSDPRGMPVATLTIPEGYTVDQIATRIGKSTPFSKKDFLALMKDKAFYEKMAKKYPKLLKSESADLSQVRYYFEGYLFPATYNIYKNESLESFVSEILDNTNKQMQPFYKAIGQQDLTVHEVLTLASLVEKEGITEKDRRKIAGVFFNRLKDNMPLQSDVTLLYAMKKHKVHLSNADTQYQSPYNLYINTGYGPGPFNNPSLMAIDAVVYPDKNDYLYFLADIKTGKVYYAKTYEEHLKLSDKYIEK